MLARYIILIPALLYVKGGKITIKQDDDESSRIVNGDKAQQGQFPFVVSLQIYLDEDYISHGQTCTLSLITTRTCLGAAHCASHKGEVMPVKKLCGIIGTIEQSQDQPCHPYSEINVHEEYNENGFHNDIATFHFLEEARVFETFADASTIPLMGNSAVLQKGQITVIGWGTLHNVDERIAPKMLRFVQLDLLPSEHCHATNSQLCIDTNGKGPCVGDSGGPNIITVDGKQIQVGVSSFVNFDGCAVGYSIATFVGSFEEWIKEHSYGEPTFITE